MKHKYAVKLLLGIFSLLLASQFSFADGSKDLYPSGAIGYRASLVSYNTNGLLYKQAYPFMTRGTQKVYVKAGEQIFMGFSSQGASATVSSATHYGTIRVFRPGNSIANRDVADFDSGTGTAAGLITNRAHELAGPAIPGTASATSGYTPYVVTADVTGIWEIDFITPGSYGGTNASPPSNYSDNLADGAWTQNAATSAIAAWDVTVVANTDPVHQTGTYTAKPGRVYMNVFNAVAGLHTAAQQGFYGTFYVLTKDGFPYKVYNNGMLGGSFTFFVNNRGFTTSPNGLGDRTYKSQPLADPTPNVKDPTAADDADSLNITHKIFYLQPSSDLAPRAVYASGRGGTTWLKLLLPPDPTATAITFTGVEGSNSYASTKGANIEFEANVAGTYRITIPGGTTNGVTYYDRVLAGPTVFGHNSVHWDGKTGVSGSPLTASTLSIPPRHYYWPDKGAVIGCRGAFPFPGYGE